LAGDHGIAGFCYYHYWFEGRRLLERPFDEVLASGEPDLPFCLCWANETWSRRWLGEEREVLLAQTYSFEDDRRHTRWLVRAFSDSRYLTVEGRPLFLVYRPRHLPQPHRTTDLLREACRVEGLKEPYLVGVDAHCSGFDTSVLGFDDTLVFWPQLGALVRNWDSNWTLARLARNISMGILDPGLQIFRHARALEAMERRRPPFPHFPCVFPGWDNSPRRGRSSVVILPATAPEFRGALDRAAEIVASRPVEQRLVFLNAWNEWGEGAVLEPDRRQGRLYLELLRQWSASSTTMNQL
jgi:hypothetical protein